MVLTPDPGWYGNMWITVKYDENYLRQNLALDLRMPELLLSGCA